MNQTSNKIKISKSDLANALTEQLDSLRKFCKYFDDGDLNVYKDIALKIRLIVHETNQSKSLLKQLKLQHITILSGYNKPDPQNLIPSHLGLVGLLFDNEPRGYSPHLLDNDLVKTSFDNWWNSQKVIIDSNKNNFTRRKIILSVVNKDGGAHYDGYLDQVYYNLTRLDTSGWIKTNSKNEITYLNPVPATIRQIAFELIKTLESIDIMNESKLYQKDS
ncbi:MAG: hypothetical protein EOO99_11825 [Pedobacter sp.]|nr:MAG: hypothetical protein EOO99_11825 [Pedobacter sp.]